MPIGLAPYTIRYNVFNKAQVEIAYKKLHDLGFNGLESGVGRNHGYSREEEMALLEKYDLRICDVYGDPTKPDEAMAFAEASGTKYICVSTLPGNMMMTADGFKAYAERLNEMAKPYASAGYKLSYHNHAQEFRNFAELGGKPGFEILLEETDPAGICFVLDVFWASAAGADPAYWLKKLKGRSVLVHFKDYAIDDRNPNTEIGHIPFRFAEIGQGNINWHAVTEACREIGIEWYCIEQDHTRGCAFESLKTSIDFMRNELKIQ
jgi:sugar phosphate isomerase/epimerase